MPFGMPFFDFLPKMVAKMDPNLDGEPPLSAPRAAQKRSQNASATQARFFIDFGLILGPISVIFL